MARIGDARHELLSLNDSDKILVDDGENKKIRADNVKETLGITAWETDMAQAKADILEVQGPGWAGESLTGLDDRIDNIIASSGTSDTEVVDARLSGATGALYTLLKDRLDAMEKHTTVLNELDVPIATLKIRLVDGQPQLVTEEL